MINRMKTIMKLDNLRTIEEMEAFINGSQAVAFVVASNKDERYQVVEAILRKFRYSGLKRREKGIVIQFLMKISGYSRQQLTRMIGRYRKHGLLIRHQKTANGFDLRYNTSLQPSDKEWRDCSKVLSRRDFISLMSESWSGVTYRQPVQQGDLLK